MNQARLGETLATRRQGRVLTVHLGNAPAHPLSLSMIRALHDVLLLSAADDGVGAIILRGEGRIFCAGHDLKEITRHRRDTDRGRAFLECLFGACSEMMVTLARSPKPVIAVVEGLATAAGLQLVAACDLAYASPGARFALPGVTNGGFCTVPAVAVGRAIGRKALMELALTGEAAGAEWAVAAGLINRIVPAAQLVPTAEAIAARVAEAHGPAVTLAKRVLVEQLDMPLAEAYAHANEAMVAHFMDPARIARDAARWDDN